MTRCWLALALAACGGPSDTPDAGAADANESTGSVSVVVTDRGEPVAGVPVIFQSADGATAFWAVTSASGSSGYDLVDGFVTVLLPKGRFGVDTLSTFAGVRMNDVLHLDLAPRGPRTVELEVTPNADVVAGPILLYTTCGAEEPYGIVPGVATKVVLACTRSKLDLLAVRIDPDTNAPVTSQFLGDIAVDAKVATFTGAYSPVPAVAISYANPHGFTFASTTESVITPQGSLLTTSVGGDPALHVIPRPEVPGAHIRDAVTASPLAGQFDQQTLYTVHAPATATDASLAPRLPSYLDTEPDPAKPPIVGAFERNRLVWSEAGGDTQANMVRARLRVHRDVPGTAWSWQIVAPRGTASELVFPVLPAFDRFDFNPGADDTVTVEELTNVRLPGTYDQARAHGFADVNAFAPTELDEVMVVARRFVPE